MQAFNLFWRHCVSIVVNLSNPDLASDVIMTVYLLTYLTLNCHSHLFFIINYPKTVVNQFILWKEIIWEKLFRTRIVNTSEPTITKYEYVHLWFGRKLEPQKNIVSIYNIFYGVWIYHFLSMLVLITNFNTLIINSVWWKSENLELSSLSLD